MEITWTPKSDGWTFSTKPSSSQVVKLSSSISFVVKQQTPMSRRECYEDFAGEYFQLLSTFGQYRRSQNILPIKLPALLSRSK
jgi:hypothetical protein